MSPITRRQLLLGTAAGAAGAAVGTSIAAPARRLVMPSASVDPAASGIEHIVFVCMENRSFDHYLGWLAQERPGTVGKQAGLSYVDANGQVQTTHHLQVRQGCGFDDPDHSYNGGRVQFNNGACDGFAN